MEAAKAAWSVTAGVLPGTVEDEYTLTLGYTSSDFEADKETTEANTMLMMTESPSPPGSSFMDAKSSGVEGVKDTIFMERRDRALAHAKELMDPQRVNWVRVEFMWRIVMPDYDRLERCVKFLAQHVIDGDLAPNLNAAIDQVLDELDSLDCAVTDEFGSGADDPTPVQKGLVEWKRWRGTEDEVDPRDRLRDEILSFYTGHYGETPTDEHLTRMCELIEEERRDHE